MKYYYNSQNTNWDELSHLYQIALLGEKSPTNLKIVFDNSLFKCFVYDKDGLIGAGRALADGVDCSYIGDVVVHPNYHASKVEKSIIKKLVERSRGHRKIILYSQSGKEECYKSLGFSKMKTAMAIFENQAQARAWHLIE